MPLSKMSKESPSGGQDSDENHFLCNSMAAESKSGPNRQSHFSFGSSSSSSPSWRGEGKELGTRSGRNEHSEDIHGSQFSINNEFRPLARSEPKSFKLSDRFHIGQRIDVLDETERWAEADILKIDNNALRIYVTYAYWESKYDEWINDIDGRTAPLNTYTYYSGGPLKRGQRIEVKDPQSKWLEAFIIDDDYADGSINVHYKGFHSKFDEAVHPRSDRIRPYGREKVIVKAAPHTDASHRYQHSQLYAVSYRNGDGDSRMCEGGAAEMKRFPVPGGQHRPLLQAQPLTPPRSSSVHHSNAHQSRNLKSSSTLANIINCDDGAVHTRQISELSDRYNQYTAALASQRLHVAPMPGDGNCFFRSVAHQMYGSDEYHDVVRQKCMDYMEEDAAFFSQFVEGGMAAFAMYVRAKRLDACWGDDPEIQAICEIYNRPAEIWAYDQHKGARKLRTFHESGGVGNNCTNASSGNSRTRPCIRLSYYGGGHYDSMISDDTYTRDLLQSSPGEVEDLAIHRARRMGSMASVRDATTSMQAKEVGSYEAIELEQLEAALALSRKDHMKWATVDLDACLLESMMAEHVEAVGEEQAADLVAMQRDILDSVAKQSEQEYMDTIISSLGDSKGVSEEELLEQARQASLMDLHGRAIQDHHFNQSCATANLPDEYAQMEDQLLQAALQQSLLDGNGLAGPYCMVDFDSDADEEAQLQQALQFSLRK